MGKRDKLKMQDLDAAVEQLKRDIFQGRFVPGQRLVEVDIMSHLEITRGRVRDVFKRLHSEGIVQIDRNRGASVRKASREEVFDIFEVLEEISILIIRKSAAGLRNRICNDACAHPSTPPGNSMTGRRILSR